MPRDGHDFKQETPTRAFLTCGTYTSKVKVQVLHTLGFAEERGCTIMLQLQGHAKEIGVWVDKWDNAWGCQRASDEGQGLLAKRHSFAEYNLATAASCSSSARSPNSRACVLAVSLEEARNTVAIMPSSDSTMISNNASHVKRSCQSLRRARRSQCGTRVINASSYVQHADSWRKRLCLECCRRSRDSQHC